MRWSRIRAQSLTESSKAAIPETRYSSPSIFELSYRTKSQPSLSNVVPGLGRLPTIHGSPRTMKRTLGRDARCEWRNAVFFLFTSNSKIVVNINGTGYGNSTDLVHGLIAVGEF